MAAATCQGQYGIGSSVTWANAEGGVKMSREDSGTGATPVPIPIAAGTNYSWIKSLVLAVTGTGTTTITNRRVSMTGACSTGLFLFWKDVAVASYVQASSGNKPTDSGSNGATPSGYTLMTTSAVQYDNASHATSSTGPNGDMASCVAAADATFVGGPGSATALPSLLLSYDEA